MGEVANVVASAISTSMANSVGLTTPRSSPTFNATSSIKPRVFISTPSENASRPAMPVSLAEANAPPTLPAVATTMMNAQSSH